MEGGGEGSLAVLYVLNGDFGPLVRLGCSECLACEVSTTFVRSFLC